MQGSGIWLRQTTDIKPGTAAQYLDFVIVPLCYRSRPVNRGPEMREWIGEAQDGGCEVIAMDWLPLADGSHLHLPELAEAAESRNCTGIQGNHEPAAGWRNAADSAQRYAALVQSELPGRGLSYSETDMANHGMNDATAAPLIAVADVVFPQSYAPGGQVDANYHNRNVRRWEDRGAKIVGLGLGLWKNGSRRHRTPDEFRKHMQHIPARIDTVCAWYGIRRDGKRHPALARVLPILREWSNEHTNNEAPRAVSCPGALGRAADDLEAIATRLQVSHPTQALEAKKMASRWRHP